MEGFGKFAAFVVVAVLSNLWRGYVLSVLWAWFMVALFALPALGIAAGIGLSTVIGMLTSSITYNDQTRPSTGDIFISAFLGPAIGLLIGWIAKQWM